MALKRSLYFVGFLILQTLSTSAWANFSVTVTIQADGESRSTTADFQASDELVIADFEDPLAQNLSIVSAQSSLGLLRAYSQGLAMGFFSSAGGTAGASFTDTLTINAPVPPGTLGEFNAAMVLNGGLGASAFNIDISDFFGYADASVSASMTLVTDVDTFSAELSGYRDTNGVFEGAEGGLLAVSVQFTFGQPFSLSVSLSARASADGQLVVGGGGQGVASYGNTAYWAGITEVTTANGASVPEFTVTSASGTDYTSSFAPDRIHQDRFEVPVMPGRSKGK